MKKRLTPPILLMLLGIVLLVLAACTTAATETAAPPPSGDTTSPTEAPAVDDSTEAPAVELFGDPLRGGLLYDKWWKPLGLDEPETDHPLWATQTTNTRGGKDTWRCKECHGWDYKGADGAYGDGSHFTGFTGVIQMAGGDPNEVLAALKGETNPDHDFSTVMDEQALIDLALFISEEVIDFSEIIGGDKAAIGGDTALGESLYQDTCAECHGPEGLAINFKKNVAKPQYIAGIAAGNPWEFVHKMRFGQPGESDMAKALDIGWTLEEQVAVLAYAQSLPEVSLVTQGGLLYDKFWKAMDADAPEGDQPLWATQDTNERDGSTTWRCKECHGWDYQGADGAYGSGSHFTGFTGVLGAASMSESDLISWLDGSTNADHDFSAYLDEAAINMLVAFIQEGTVDMSQYINADKTVNGDPALGEALFEECAGCHGDDGKTINFKDDSDPEYLGDLARGNPWETLHKAANGQPSEAMPSGLNLGWSWQDLADLLAYIQTIGE